MGAAYLRVIGFDGLSMTGTQFVGSFLADFDIASQFPLEAVMAQAVGDFPEFVRGQPGDKVIPLHIIINEGGPTTQAMIDTLKTVFSPFQDPAYLRVDDQDGNTRRMLVKSLGLVPWETHSEKSYVASLEAPEPIWEGDTLASGTATITTNPQSWVHTNTNANERSWPTVDMTVSAVKGNANHWRRRWPMTIAWRSPLPGVDSLGGPYPIDVVDALLPSSTEITASRLLASGDDLRVLVDGVEVDRWLGNWNTTTSRVWCNIAFQPARVATLAANIIAGTPGSGDALSVSNVEGTAEFPQKGILLIGTEAITYNGKTADSFLDIRRGQRQTAAAGHTAGDPIYWVEHDIQVVSDYTAAGAPPASTDRQPIFNLNTSTNGRWIYDQAESLLAPDTLRSGQWLRELRSEALFAAYHCVYPDGANKTFVEDALPEAGRPNFDTLSCYTPCFANGTGTPTGTAAGLQLDYLVDHAMIMEIIAADNEGFEALIARRDIRGPAITADQIIGTPATHGDQTFTLDNASRVGLHARSQTITGLFRDAALGQTDAGLDPSPNRDGQGFRLDQTVVIRQITLWLLRVGVTTKNLEVALYNLDPVTGPIGANLVVVQAALPASGYAVSPGSPVSIFLEPTDLIALPAGLYMIQLQELVGGGAGDIGVALTLNGQPLYPASTYFQEVAGVWGAQGHYDAFFEICGADGVQQGDGPHGTGRTVQFSDVRLAFNASFTPAIVRGTQQDIYWFDALFESLTTGQQFAINAIMPVASGALVIDAVAHTAVVQVTGAHDVSVLGSVEPSDPARWLYILPGTQTFRWTEVLGAATVTVTQTYVKRWT